MKCIYLLEISGTDPFKVISTFCGCGNVESEECIGDGCEYKTTEIPEEYK